MRWSERWVCALWLPAAAVLVAACGGGGGGGSTTPRPSVDESILASGEVVYNAAGLMETTVTVTLLDTDGWPVEGVTVELNSSRPEADTVLESQGLTSDANGQAAFQVTSDTFGESEFSADLPDLGLTLTHSTTVDFSLTASMTLGQVRLLYPLATVDATVTLADDVGPVAGASIGIESDRSADTVDPAVATTEGSGAGFFTVSTMLEGSAVLRLRVGTLNGLLDLGTAEFHGPTISGDVSFNQLYGELTRPRVGVVYLDVENWDQGFGPPRELVSSPLAIEFTETRPYQLTLPISVPTAHLFRPNDPNLPADFRMAPYAVVVYDDVGTSTGVMDASDLLVGVTDDLPSVVFASGTMPQSMANLQPGYNMFDLFVEPATVLPWVDWADAMDVSVTMAQVPGATVTGLLNFGNAMGTGTPITVSAVMFDPAALMAGNPWDPANNENLVSASVLYESNDATPYGLVLPDLTQHAHYDDWVLPIFGPPINIIMLVAYWDINMNGRPEPASEPVLPPFQPWGVEGPFLWYLHGGVDWLMHFMSRAIHPGYMLIRFPLEYEVVGVDAPNGVLYLDDDIEPNHTWISFKVTRQDGQGDDQIIVQGNDLDTGTTVDNAASTSEDLSQVQAGDVLVITEEIEDMEVLDFTRTVDFQLP